MKERKWAVIFDLDGVLTYTAELHYQSWQWLADELGIPFGRQANEALRGLSRPQSLQRVLGERSAAFTEQQKTELAGRKNEDYIRRVHQMTPADLFPGAAELLRSLRERGVAVAVASASRNAGLVIERLGIAPLLDALVDGNQIQHSKPHPEVFLLAARALDVPPERCVVVEDAASGVEAALKAGMRVVGIGPPARVAGAHLVAASIAELTAAGLMALVET